MSFLESLLRQSYEKVENKEANWCGTPTASKPFRVKVAGTVKKDKPYDFLLGPISRDRCEHSQD